MKRNRIVGCLMLGMVGISGTAFAYNAKTVSEMVVCKTGVTTSDSAEMVNQVITAENVITYLGDTPIKILRPFAVSAPVVLPDHSVCVTLSNSPLSAK
jgi:hypothetical protein